MHTSKMLQFNSHLKTHSHKVELNYKANLLLSASILLLIHVMFVKRFPKDSGLHFVWAEFCGRGSDWKVPDGARICSAHFSDVCYDRTRNGLRNLRPKSIPTLHPYQVRLAYLL